MILHVDNPVVEVHDLTVSYDRKPVLWGVDLTLPAGSLVGVIGPNGAGKSTLIKAIMDLLPASSGYVRIFDEPIKQVRSRISYVPQRESVDWDFPASVFDVVLMGRYGKLGLFNRPRKADKDAAMQALEKVGMQTFADRQISQLSGGQQQRVFLARALAQKAQVFFLDEPFVGIDAASEETIIHILKELRTNGKTILVVHHDLSKVNDYFDQLIVLNKELIGSGKIDQVLQADVLSKAYSGRFSFLDKLEVQA